ncbi:spore coat protein [Anaeroselena agilis]|uniref:Spore coat protein n=1 Tax=Anaeroselena agilis TaxID=3063788 RepID=A0ABU3P346_9FIRM|nr:spore coat protein [Selenomonadales bacterium 4137-cl]
MVQMSGQNQQSQQGQMSGQSTQISDRDIMQVCLNEAKHMASSLNIYIQEATSEQLRRDYMTVLGEVYSQEKQLFDYMQQKGYYSVKNASPQDITKAQSKFSGQSQQQGMQ